MTDYEIVLERFKKQNIDVQDKDIIINGVLNGAYRVDYTFSDDMQWICIPVVDEEWSVMTGEYQYKPKCFQVESMYETFLGNEMLRRSEVIILKRPKE